MRCIGRQPLVGLGRAQGITPHFLAELGTRRLREGPSSLVDSGEQGMDLLVQGTCSFFGQQGADVPICSHW